MVKYLAVITVALALSQPTFAKGMDMDMDSADCKVIAKACMHAGYSKKAGKDKKFWHNCMKPVLLGQTVAGVTVKADTVKSCRDAKITKMENELKMFKDAQ